MTEINTTLSANGVFFSFFFQALQFSFNTAIREPSKFTRGFVFFKLLSFFVVFLLFFLNVSIVADWCLFIDAFTVLFCYQSIYIGELGDAGI